MSKAAGSAPSGYQTGSAVTRPASAANAPASPAPADRINSPRDDESRGSSPSPAKDQKGVGQPESAQPESAQPGSDQEAAGQPLTGQPLTGQPLIGRPVAARPGTGRGTGSHEGAPPRPSEYPPLSRPASVSQPSWAEVIGTTWRLWLHRRVLRDQDTPGQRRPGSRRRAGIFGLVIIVFAAGALTVALAQGGNSSGTRHSGATSAKKARTPHLSPASLAAAAANRQDAAAWVAAQVGHSVIVSCDPVMCSALMARGFPTGDLLPLSPSATDPMGSQIVVSTTVLRSQLGSRLPNVYAPVVIASFGTGATRVDIRVESPDGSQAYLVAQRADLAARVAAGQQLLRNKELHVSGSSRQAIAAGHVDSRLLITLAALLSQEHQVYISRFGDAGPGTAAAATAGATAGVPLRMVRIAALVSAHGPRKNTYLHSVLNFLQAQQPPFQAGVSVLHLRGKTLIQIHYSAPMPLGLLGAHASP